MKKCKYILNWLFFISIIVLMLSLVSINVQAQETDYTLYLGEYIGIDTSNITGSPAINSTGLILSYDMETLDGSDMEDFSISGLDGTIIGASDTSGIIGRAREFDGSSDTIEIGSDVFSNDDLREGTISVWVNPDDLGATERGLVDLEGRARLGVNRQQAGQYDKYRFYVHPGDFVTLSTSDYEIGNWTHVAATWGGYNDGFNVGTDQEEAQIINDQDHREKFWVIRNSAFDWEAWVSNTSGALDTIDLYTSTDGKNWVAYASNPVLSEGAIDLQDPSVVLNGSTYYMYVEDSTAVDNIRIYTSSDGISWSFQTTFTTHDPQSPVVFYESGWWMYYEAIDSFPTGYDIRVASSNDGLSWTDQGVILDEVTPNHFAPNSIYKDNGGTYHLFMHYYPSGAPYWRAWHATSTSITSGWSKDANSLIAGYSGNGYPTSITISVQPDGEVWFYVWRVDVGDIQYQYDFFRGYDEFLQKIYINGIEENSDSGGSPSPEQDTRGNSVGGLYVGAPYVFDGTIDEVLIFSRRLSATEISYLAHAGQPYTFSFDENILPTEISNNVTWIIGDSITWGAQATYENFTFTANITSWSELVISWESYSNISNKQIDYNLTLQPNTLYRLFVNGTLQNNLTTDSNGEISFNWLSWSSNIFNLELPLSINSIANINGITESNYNYQTTTNKIVDTWNLTQAPNWLSIDSNGLISGIPLYAGDYSIAVRANTTDESDTQTYILSIIRPAQQDLSVWLIGIVFLVLTGLAFAIRDAWPLFFVAGLIGVVYGVWLITLSLAPLVGLVFIFPSLIVMVYGGLRLREVL